jgi:error-prone DNA polymerase
LIKDAQRHGQRFRPIDVLHSDYLCRVESEAETKPIRLGFNYVRGLRKEAGLAIERERKIRPFDSLRDLVRRVPELQKNELAALGELGALNALPEHAEDRHRRGSLWQAELALQPVGDLLEPAAVDGEASPLEPMTDGQRTYADFRNSGLTIGKHPMAFHRAHMSAQGVFDAATAKQQRNGLILAVAGCVITRQRPGTAKGFVFLSLEDETGVVNVIIRPDLFDRRREICSAAPYVVVKGVLQSIKGVVSVKAASIEQLTFKDAAVVHSHDFH